MKRHFRVSDVDADVVLMVAIDGCVVSVRKREGKGELTSPMVGACWLLLVLWVLCYCCG